MPDDTILSDPSTPSLDRINLRHRLTEQLGRSEQQLLGLESVLSDMMNGHDTIQEDRDGTRLVVDSIREDVRRIRRAIARLDGDAYGKCVACGTMIAAERIEAIPTVTHCTRCA